MAPLCARPCSKHGDNAVNRVAGVLEACAVETGGQYGSLFTTEATERRLAVVSATKRHNTGQGVRRPPPADGIAWQGPVFRQPETGGWRVG